MNLKNKYCNKKSVYFFLTNTQKHSIIARERIIKSNQAGKKSEYKFLVTMKANKNRWTTNHFELTASTE